ncbi:MAG: aspartate aminotransferase family protein [Deltaproteobacteria bacterium]|nr:aspartate aminotransferase family protein [Deltaproteobacteria bacterium]
MNTQDVLGMSQKYIMQTYRRLPVVWEKGAGMYLFDKERRRYLDFLGGIAVCALGHSHPNIIEAIREQADKLMHTSNLYHIEAQAICAKMLVESSFAAKVFFCNSGAEANEAAIKLARKYGNTVLNGKNEIISMRKSFHGRTLATITATGQEKFQKGFEPLPTGFVYADFNDIQSVESLITDKTCAVLTEPIQAEGGVIVPDDAYLKDLRMLCDSKNILLIFDEVQVGVGRTGKLYAYEEYSVKPDIMTLAKALGGGFPVGAMLASEKVAGVFVHGDHASTFGGNPLAMVAVKAVLETIAEECLLDNCRLLGAYLREGLERIKSRMPLIKEIRGKGLLIGVELAIEALPVIEKCLERGLIVGSAGANVLRFAPPLIINKAEANMGLEILASSLEEIK